MEGTHIGQGFLSSLQVETYLTFWNQNGDSCEGLEKCPF